MHGNRGESSQIWHKKRWLLWTRMVENAIFIPEYKQRRQPLPVRGDWAPKRLPPEKEAF